MPVTLKDVAKMAGVSTKTVSRVVNDQGEISASTRQRVQAAIDQLGYRPNIVARNLVHKRTNNLAVVAWGIDYFGPSHTIVGIHQQADELGYYLFLNLIRHPEEANITPLLDGLIARRVDGIIWAVPEVGDNRSWISPRWLEQLPPIIFLNMDARPGLSVVAVDNRAGSIMAVRHLIERGCRKIGLITGPLAAWEARERHAGWLKALTQAGLPITPALVVEGDWSAASGERGMRTLLAQAPDVEAVFASNDQMALGAMQVAHQIGRRIPADLAIVGFDNIPESPFFSPPLTTVYQHLIEVGRCAVEVLHQSIENRRNQVSQAESGVTLLAPELIVRASSLC